MFKIDEIVQTRIDYSIDQLTSRKQKTTRVICPRPEKTSNKKFYPYSLVNYSISKSGKRKMSQNHLYNFFCILNKKLIELIVQNKIYEYSRSQLSTLTLATLLCLSYLFDKESYPRMMRAMHGCFLDLVINSEYILCKKTTKIVEHN